MGATDELRRLLDERGVEYRIDDAKTARSTEWEFGEHSSAMFTEYDDGECVFVASGHTWTPEQAIAATVGRSCASCPEMDNPDSYIMHLHRALEVADRGVGTCHSTSNWTNVFKCSVCGFEYDFVTDPYQGPKFCPRCGRKVVVK